MTMKQDLAVLAKAEYIEVSAEVRYWEDATVNGQEDTDGSLIPFKSGLLWKPVIRIADGVVMNWPQGTVASIHYKVCDAGEYWLLDAEKKRIAKASGYYVPDGLCHGDTGCGDYIIFDVDGSGQIAKYSKPDIELSTDESESGWMPLDGDAP
jgi:hypothetical protein